MLVSRHVLASLALVLAAALSFGGADAGAATTFAVTSTVDAVDVLPGDGVCSTAAGLCTLRAAVQEANALAGADTITLPAATYALTIGGFDDVAAVGDLDIRSDVALLGSGATTTVIDATALERARARQLLVLSVPAERCSHRGADRHGRAQQPRWRDRERGRHDT